MKSWRLALLLVCLNPLSGWAMGSAKLTVHTADGRNLGFTAELATNREELTQGLMNRESVAPNTGMLFDFGAEHPIAMWMKNTLIPLDMIFIGNDGHILGIAERTVPMSLETIPSPGPVRAVLEVAGGTADHLRIKTGDRIEGAFFSK